MQRHAKPTFGAVVVLTVVFAAGGARTAGREGIKEPLPPLPRNVQEDCSLSALAGEPKIPCELVLGASSRGGDRAVLVRERGGARRRGVAVQVRGASVELFGAGHAVGAVGADLGFDQHLDRAA